VLFYGTRDLGAVAFQRSAPRVEAEHVRAVVELLAGAGGVLAEDALRVASGIRRSELTAILARLDEAGIVEVAADRGTRLCGDASRGRTIAREAVAAQEARRAYERSRLEMMRSYAELSDCRRGFILNYFGEAFAPPCGACDICDAGSAGTPVTAPFSVGERVEHQEFGHGSVQRVEHDRVFILFDERGYTALDLAVVADQRLLRRSREAAHGARS
jgi:ATP-dependent DNA helicase RecQ